MKFLQKTLTKSDIKGIVVSMVTPFKGKDASLIDHQALEKLTKRLVESGVHGLLSLGTTGEFALMDKEERHDVIKTVVKAADGKIPVIAGVSLPGTRDVIELAEDAHKAGANFITATGPYGYTTSSEGLLKHFQMLIDESTLPLMIYDIPERTGYTIPPKIVKRLVEANPKRVVAAKVTTNNFEELLEYVRMLKNDISIMTGSDHLALLALEMGTAGAVMGSANIFPKLITEMYNDFVSGNIIGAKEIQEKIDPFLQAMHLGTYPAGIKAALRLIGYDTGPVRPPLVDLTAQDLSKIRNSISWKVKKNLA